MSGSGRRPAVVLVAGALHVGLLALIALPPLLLWGRLPEPMADHWGLRGHPTGSMPKEGLLGITLAVGVVGAVLSAIWASRPAGMLRGAAATGGGRPGSDALLVGGLFLSGLGASTSLVPTLANLDAVSWHAVRIGAVHVVGILAIPYGLAAAGVWLARRARGGVPDPDPGEVARLGLGPDERAFWSGGARSRWAAAVGVAGVGGGGVIWLAVGWLFAVPVLAVAFALVWISSVAVTASHLGLTVRYGPLGWPVTRIPLRQIRSADTLRLASISFGYRGSLALFGAAAVIVRNGPALRLNLTGNRRFLVTVDDAATGAALINDELARSGG